MNRNFVRRAGNWNFEADRESQCRDQAVKRATARKTQRRERAEAAKWNREIGKERTRPYGSYRILKKLRVKIF